MSNLDNFVPDYGNMKVNLHFREGVDVGRVTDTILDMKLDAPLMAFAEATEHHLSTGKDLFVARSKHMNVFTDYESFITIDVLAESGEEDGGRIVQLIAFTDGFDVMDGTRLVVNNA